MGREEGGGVQDGQHLYTMGNMVDSSQCMAKPIQYCKVK